MNVGSDFTTVFEHTVNSEENICLLVALEGRIYHAGEELHHAEARQVPDRVEYWRNEYNVASALRSRIATTHATTVPVTP